MGRPTCSPRQQNLLDTAAGNLATGVLSEGVAQRFLATQHEPPQRDQQDLGVGLCGRGGSRLATTLDELSCPACRELLLGAWSGLLVAQPSPW